MEETFLLKRKENIRNSLKEKLGKEENWKLNLEIKLRKLKMRKI